MLTIQSVFSQIDVTALPPCPDSTCLWGCGLPLKEVLDESDLIFEGRVLIDSPFCYQTFPYNYHRVLVLKEFKGVFTSDTIELAHVGMCLNCMHQTMGVYTPDIHLGVEGLFFIGKLIPNIPMMIKLSTEGCGFVNVCDKKDVVKEVYEPIEAATGQKYIEVHPNTCATKKKEK